jgi:maltose alpha-D-glucosyltransferase/alpha-amylase
MAGESLIDLWWKNAIVYCLDVESFLDSNGDGIGDFRGLTERIDYLAGLGVTCLWLMPFFPSAQRDDGYDITDYFSVDPRLGDLGAFTELIQTAEANGIKVIADLVVNHTSDKHPWFQSARADRSSPFHDYYIWSSQKPKGEPSLIFPGEQTSNWTYEKKVRQYYFHHFHSFQPDLNPANPVVANAMKEIMGFWLQQGLSGFRVDAVPFLIEMQDEAGVDEMTPHAFLRHLRSFLARRKGDSVMLGEVDLLPHEQVKYFGADDELQMMFNFVANQNLYLSLARGNPDALRRALRDLPPIPETGQWANFLKNHDEANIGGLTPAEQNEVYEAMGPEESMRLFDRGIRRRLPTMLNGNQQKIRMAYSLLFALPGTPVLFYGEEIGMGENLALEGRTAIRTPMQWKPTATGGFTTARLRDLPRPFPKGDYAPEKVNVYQQRQDPHSMINWMERLIRRRKETGEFGFGQVKVFDVGPKEVFAHSCEWDGRRVIALHNFSDRAQDVDFESELGKDVVEVFDTWRDDDYPPPVNGRAKLGPFGYRWLRVIKRGQEILM